MNEFEHFYNVECVYAVFCTYYVCYSKVLCSKSHSENCLLGIIYSVMCVRIQLETILLKLEIKYELKQILES